MTEEEQWGGWMRRKTKRFWRKKRKRNKGRKTKIDWSKNKRQAMIG
jgi:hypothetical protein